jgi:DNA-directed RNA polymerase subunit RPC12/RpoP
MYICKYCSKPVKVRKNEVKVFCNKKCQKSYSRENPIEFSYNKGKTLEDIIGFERSRKVKEKIRKTQQARHPKTELICFRCKSKKVVTIQKKQKILRDLKGKKYFCSNCKAIRKQESKRRAYKCGNCGKTIYRLVSERTTVKFVKRAKKFCDRKCYLEFYKTHPQRYKKQREYAGFVSVQAFRMKENFRYSDIAFSSASERKCAIYLEKEFNLVLKEGITCHVKINTIEVDFLIDKIVIEYHQCYSNPEKLNLSERIRIWRKKGYKFRYEYRTLDEYYKSRKKKLPKDYSLIVIQNTDRSTLRKMKEQIWSYQDNK